jgi:polysaccharide export outer membrane protein
MLDKGSVGRGTMIERRVLGCVVGLSLLTAACSSMPAAGPMSSEIVDRASNPASTVDFDYMLIEVTEPILNTLSLRPIESLASSFGVGGPPPVLVIGVGDSVNVTIWEAGPGGLFSSAPTQLMTAGSRTATIPEQMVAHDGTISVPYAGRIRVVGLRPGDVEDVIVKALTGKAIEPQAVVTVSRNISNTVSVSGDVMAGARVPLTLKGDRVIDVISSAGGLRIPANEAWVRLTRGSRTVSVAYNTILARPSENIFLRSGDVVTVVRRPQTFTMFGAAGRNAVVPFEADVVTLEEAVAKAGGLLDFRADPQGVFLFRFEAVDLVRKMAPSPDKTFGHGVVPVVYRLNFRDAGSYFLARRFDIRDKDLLYVANHPVNELAKFLNIVGMAVNPTASAALAGAEIMVIKP